jgi:hypothetical protein
VTDGTDPSSLDKVEGLVKRVLERLGSAVDKTLGPGKDLPTLTPHQVGDLIALLETAVQSNLKPGSSRGRQSAPNRFKVLMTYEQASQLSQQYQQALAAALTAAIFEFINNRRYETLAPVKVEVSRDLFVKSISVKASFSDEQALADSAQAESASVRAAAEGCWLDLEASDGGAFHLELKIGGPPVYIGRSAGCGVRIDLPGISRLHCSLAARQNGDAIVSDVGSANGTYVNGQIVSIGEVVGLKPGDMIAIGDVELTVKAIS